MAVNEQIVTGRKFRKLVDEATKLWQRISFWTKAVDVEFNDSKTAETKLGAIDGITDSLASTSSRIAASAKALNQVNNNLSNCKLVTEGSGANTKYYIQNGADTASKKSLCNSAKIKSAYIAKGTSSYVLTADSGYKFISAFLSRYESESQHAFWSEEFEINYAAGNTTQNKIILSTDRKTITAPRLQTDYRFYICGVEVHA